MRDKHTKNHGLQQYRHRQVASHAFSEWFLSVRNNNSACGKPAQKDQRLHACTIQILLFKACVVPSKTQKSWIPCIQCSSTQATEQTLKKEKGKSKGQKRTLCFQSRVEDLNLVESKDMTFDWYIIDQRCYTKKIDMCFILEQSMHKVEFTNT